MDEEDIFVAEGQAAIITPGVYEVMYHSHETAPLWGGKKLIVHFRITGPIHVGKMVCRYYNVERFIGKPGPSGKFVPGRGSHFFREYLNLFEPQALRITRLSMRKFKHTPLLAEVREVTEGFRGMPLAPAARYSVINRLLKVLEDEHL